MKRKIIETILGFIIIVGSILGAFIYIGDSMLLLLCAVIFLLGMGVLFHAGRIDTSKIKFTDPVVVPTGQVLDRNNKIIKEWNNINQTKTKLKMVGVAADDASQQPVS